MPPRVLISDNLSPAAVAIFRERGVEAHVKPGLDKDELARIIGGYDGLAIRSATKVTGKLLEQAHRLKIVGRGEIWRDANGVFVAAFPGHFDFVNAEEGKPATVIGGGKTTYGALTLGLNIKGPTWKPFTETETSGTRYGFKVLERIGRGAVESCAFQSHSQFVDNPKSANIPP